TATSTATVAAAPSSSSPASCENDTADMVEKIRTVMPRCDDRCNITQDIARRDCRNAEEAAPYIVKSLCGFEPGEKAAALAHIGYESRQLYYKNLSGGNKTLGTAGGLSWPTQRTFAAYLFGKEAVDHLADDEIRRILNEDQYNFATPAWLQLKFCDPSILGVLNTGTDKAYLTYWNHCAWYNVPRNESRWEYWQRAKEVFHL
ncbi:hypothetical protein QBC40DRAFT_180266, partial [Triangularia verruculosa]